MRVLVATSDVPFVEGGHRVIARALTEALRESGHSAEIITTPQNRFGRQFAAYMATRLTDVERTGNGEPVDRLISIRFPSYALKHPNHVCWLNHRMREYYDLWPEWTSRLSRKGKIKESIRRSLIHSADRYLLKHNVKKVFAQSQNVQRSLRIWGDIPSEVLYPPPPAKEYRTESYDDFVLSPSRLEPLKRIGLLIEAMRRIDHGRAIIVGEGSEATKLINLINDAGLQNRIEMRGHIGQLELAELYGRCRAVYYAPVNEDFGMVTLESFFSRKPVITAVDSGGPVELVSDHKNGWIVSPDPDSVAAALREVYEDAALAEKLGNSGYSDWKSVNWPATVERLLEQSSVKNDR